MRWEWMLRMRYDADQFTAHHGDGAQQEFLSPFVWFRKNGVAMVEVVKLLRQLKCVLRQISGLGSGDALIDDVRRL